MNNLADVLIDWYERNGRDLPWRQTTDPYKIWISEIILQQTRVAQGYDYYCRFIGRFPDVASLAEAGEDEVMKYWQGLGYYSRARNLHEAARSIHAAGSFPRSYKEVLKLKGVGEYTAAAICSFAYGLPHAVVDGNVYRVLSRWMGVDTPIDTTEGKKEFAALADALLDRDRPGAYNQAIMDFGALVCTAAAPRCEDCPLKDSCVAYAGKRVADLPCKARKTKVTDRFFNYFFIHTGDACWLYKRGKGDIWQNLYEFPLLETSRSYELGELLSLPACRTLWGDREVEKVSLVEAGRKHVLSHRRIYASCIEILLKDGHFVPEGFLKVRFSELEKFPVSNLISHFFSLILKPNHKNE